MTQDFRTKDGLGYFRMGLVTGIVDKGALVEWADHVILHSPAFEYEMIELSLSGSRSYSEIVWILGDLEGQAEYGLSLKLLLAHAGLLLEEDPARAGDIIVGLRLLVEEMYFPKDVKSALVDLRNHLEMHHRSMISFEDLLRRLSAFLDPYRAYRSRLGQTVCPPFGADGPEVATAHV
jgi:hypothetical protein